MTCDDVRARLIDALALGQSTFDADVRAHLDACAACRDVHTIWQQLGDLPVPRPAPDARARFDRRPLVARRPSWYVGVWAATVLIATLAGYSLGSHRASTTPARDQSTFLILLHVDSTFHHGQTPAASAAMLAEYVQWANRLPRGVTLVSTASLADSTVWFGPSHAVSAQGDHLAGFLMIQAHDPAEAMRVAATCPHLKYGGRIELRMINRHS